MSEHFSKKWMEPAKRSGRAPEFGGAEWAGEQTWGVATILDMVHPYTSMKKTSKSGMKTIERTYGKSP